jgi:diguanylate cyclase (GGDEF)-like protein/PAS domain S-box-containing protein
MKNKLKTNKYVYMLCLRNTINFIIFLFGILSVLKILDFRIQLTVHHSNMYIRGHAKTAIIFLVFLAVLLAFIYSQIKRNTVFYNYEASEEKYHQVVNTIAEVLFQTDLEGGLVFLNPAWTAITGFTMEESLGVNFLEFVYISDKKKNEELFKSLIKRTKEEFRHEVRYIKKDGGICWMEVYSGVLINDSGRVIGSTGTLRSITKRKLVEQKLIKKDRLLDGIAKSANVLLHTTNYENAINEALNILGQVTEVDSIYVFENETYEQNEEKFLHVRGFWSKNNNNHIKNVDKRSWKGIGISRWYDILSRGDLFSGLTKELPEEEQKHLNKLGILSVLVMPIFIDGVFWGIIAFENNTEEYEWTEVEENTLMVAAANIGGLFKRRQAENTLKKAMSDDFKQIVKNLQNIVFKVIRVEDGSFGFSFIEGKYGDKIGLNTSNVKGKKFSEIFSKRVASYLSINCEKAFQGNITNANLTIGRTTFYVTLTPIYKNNSIYELIGSAIDITNQKKAEEKIKVLAFYDSLTGLVNRTMFIDTLSKAIQNSELHDNQLAVLFLDFDRFKNINDTLGHAVGDLMLKQIAERLKKSSRKEEVISRMGGDEFIILLPDINSRVQVEEFAKKLLNLFSKPINVSGHELFITSSIGISIYPYDGTENESLIKNADTAMYRAKEKGGNKYEFYKTSMNEKALDRLELENDLRKALDKDELFLVYQPKVNLNTGKVIGAEALVRWKHAARGIVSPVDFIPLAEETGLIISIGEWVIKTACLQIKEWKKETCEDLRISINISPQQFLRGNLTATIEKAIKDAEIDGRFIDLEITESCLMENSEKNMKIVQNLKAIGAEISVDDFGKGFSSLSYLKQFDVDVLKIDSSFIKDIPSNTNDMAITTAIISMAHDLNLKVVAEGVETEEQLEFLLSKSCDEMQGYYFSRPISSTEFGEMLKAQKVLYNKTIYIEDSYVV